MNPSGATPTMVIGMLLMVDFLPTIAGSPLKRRCQYAWLITTTGCPPGVTSSCGVNRRPAAARRPITWK